MWAQHTVALMAGLCAFLLRCPLSANIYKIDFIAFKIRALSDEGETVLFDIRKDPDEEEPPIDDDLDDSVRSIKRPRRRPVFRARRVASLDPTLAPMASSCAGHVRAHQPFGLGVALRSCPARGGPMLSVRPSASKERCGRGGPLVGRRGCCRPRRGLPSELRACLGLGRPRIGSFLGSQGGQ